MVQAQNRPLSKGQQAKQFRGRRWAYCLELTAARVINESHSVEAVEAEDLFEVPYDNRELVLSARDTELLLEAMENPPEPSEGLINLFL